MKFKTKCIKCYQRKYIPFHKQGNSYCVDCLPDDKRCTRITKKSKRCKNPSKPGTVNCQTHLSKRYKTNSQKKSISPWPGGRGPGYVYIMNLNKDDYYKIGQTGNGSQRLNEIQSGNPWAEYTICELVYNASHVEKMLHRLFKEQRLQREIFRLSKEDIERSKEIIEEHRFSPESDNF